MSFEDLVKAAVVRGASDVHLEPGLPVTMRVRGDLHRVGPAMAPEDLEGMARAVVGEPAWRGFLDRRSCDLATTVAGARCRINVLRTLRGTGMAVRILSTFQPTLERLNLHPELRRLVSWRHGLVVISGPTGSGKSSTLAALLAEVTSDEARHVVTIEQPIEYVLPQRRSFVRQREVGRDTPSFDQGILDAMREDPDVLVVGEMRQAETMRLVLNAAETGHLVMATVHSSNCAEALQRIAGAFPAEIRAGICAQLADCVRAVVSQRMTWRDEQQLRVPEVELLLASTPARAVIRSGALFKLGSVIDTGSRDGQWSYERYRQWLGAKSSWSMPDDVEEELARPDDAAAEAPAAEPEAAAVPAPAASDRRAAPPPRDEEEADVFVIDPAEGSMSDILSEIEGRPDS